MSKKHYVVWKGLKPGIFDSWPKAKAQIDGRKDAQFMGFPSLEEAAAAYDGTYSQALSARTTSKNTGGATPAPDPAATRSAAKPKSRAKTSAKKAPEIADINIYCDGACSPNPGKSGTGIAVYQQEQLIELWYGLYAPNGTNNTAELNGLLEAFKLAVPHLKQNKTVQVLSDSKYSIDCITKWAKGWKAKGWTRGKGEEIKNLALIQEIFTIYELMKNHITINHVRGHANIEGNELSDRMAVQARSLREVDFVQYTKTMDIPTILAMTSG
jgi:ribonuclease HI